MTLMSNIISPFIHCHSPQEAKDMLDSMKDNKLGSLAHKIIFKKVLV